MIDKFQFFITVFIRVDNLIVRMSKLRTLRKRRAVSPVIATVILVAVTITVAVAVSYWMSSIAGQYTGFEKVEIQSGYATKTEEAAAVDVDPDGIPLSGDEYTIPASVDGWRVTIKLKNTGSAPSTITSCFVNEKPIEEYLIEATTTSAIIWQYLDETGAPTDMTEAGVTLESGTSATIYVTITKTTDAGTVLTGVTFTSGTTVNVKLHSAGGMDYIRLIQLS